MQTAFEIFKDHHNFDNLKFIMDPHLREHLHVGGDLPNSLKAAIDYGDDLFGSS